VNISKNETFAVLGALAAVVTVAVGGGTLYNWVFPPTLPPASAPAAVPAAVPAAATVVAVVDWDHYVPNPAAENELNSCVQPDRLAEWAKATRGHLKSADAVLDSFDAQLSSNAWKRTPIRLSPWRFEVSVEVKNTSNVLATKAKLFLSAQRGLALVGPEEWDFRRPPLEWENEIPVGDVPPHSTVYVRLWTRMWFDSGTLKTMSVVYEGGSATIQDENDADLRARLR